MIPFPVYFGISLDDLQVGFSQFRLEDAIYAGFGADSSLWTAEQRIELARDVNEAYRWILYPDTLPEERMPHTWTFMEQTTTLTTESGTWQYTLPIDFGSMVGHHMFFEAEQGWTPLCLTSDAQILERRQYAENTGHPLQFALRWKQQAVGARQRQEVLFWPTPDGAYTLTYKYAVFPRPLSESNPYPLGGPRISQLMIEACKAIGEAKKNGFRGDQWNLFKERLRDAIRLDKGTNTERSLGVMRPGYQPGSRRGLIDLQGVDYYFGPDASYGPTLYQLEA